MLSLCVDSSALLAVVLGALAGAVGAFLAVLAVELRRERRRRPPRPRTVPPFESSRSPW